MPNICLLTAVTKLVAYFPVFNLADFKTFYKMRKKCFLTFLPCAQMPKQYRIWYVMGKFVFLFFSHKNSTKNYDTNIKLINLKE